MNIENLTYWTTYTGQLTIYVGNDFVFDYVNANAHNTEQDAVNSITKYWDNSGIKPFFRGEVSRIKEQQNDITIYVDSIGRRFQQKIPDDFRQSFINNQNVRDAFQAICEFLGVFFICPPKTVTDNGETETDGQTPSDGQENDVSNTQQAEQTMQNIAKNKVNQQQSSTNSNSDTQNQNDENNQQDSSNTENSDDLTNNEEVPDIQNGYGDINFDANGAIVHGSAVIETSPDMAETLIAMEENPLEKYLEDETGIIESVNKFLDGDMFEELHNKVMDYGAITIEPKSTSSSDITSGTSPGATSGDNPNNSTENSGSSSNGGVSSSFGNTSSRARDKNGWINGQYYIDGKIYLSDAYINSLTPSQAWAKYTSGLQTGVYRDGTLNRLRARGYWQPIK
jgi:hypothetical protein